MTVIATNSNAKSSLSPSANAASRIFGGPRENGILRASYTAIYHFRIVAQSGRGAAFPMGDGDNGRVVPLFSGAPNKQAASQASRSVVAHPQQPADARTDF